MSATFGERHQGLNEEQSTQISVVKMSGSEIGSTAMDDARIKRNPLPPSTRTAS